MSATYTVAQAGSGLYHLVAAGPHVTRPSGLSRSVCVTCRPVAVGLAALDMVNGHIIVFPNAEWLSAERAYQSGIECLSLRVVADYTDLPLGTMVRDVVGGPYPVDVCPRCARRAMLMGTRAVHVLYDGAMDTCTIAVKSLAEAK